MSLYKILLAIFHHVVIIVKSKVAIFLNIHINQAILLDTADKSIQWLVPPSDLKWGYKNSLQKNSIHSTSCTFA